MLVRKLTVPVAALAATLLLSPASRAEARAHRGKSVRGSSPAAGAAASRPAPGARSARGKGKGKAKAKARTGHVRRGGAKGRTARAKAAPGRSRRHKTATKVIHQNELGEVVIDKVAVVGMPAAPLAVAGGTRELLTYNYPPAPCEGADSYPYLPPSLLEAHVHEVAADAPSGPLADLEEGDAPAPVPAATGARASIAALARKLGSFFRPKSSDAEVRPRDVDLTELVNKSFLIPVAGVDADRLRDSFLSSRGRHAQHLAIDIGAPRGTPILATTDGEIVRISRERRGGKAIYQKDATGQYLLFYCHLSEYVEGLQAGRQVHKGDVIGFVGSTGHVIGGPHLHFSITRVPDDTANFKKGLAINPYLLFLAGVP